ncbi:MAG: nucleotidyltransferase domain-containing protein [Caldilineaceae bacterium]
MQKWSDRRKRKPPGAARGRSHRRHVAERFGATRVILFGSLARGRFRLDSDIDLAVAGLAKGDLFRAMAGALEFTNRWVDIKPLEEVDPHFRLRILETGIDL